MPVKGVQSGTRAVALKEDRSVESWAAIYGCAMVLCGFEMMPINGLAV